MIRQDLPFLATSGTHGFSKLPDRHQNVKRVRELIPSGRFETLSWSAVQFPAPKKAAPLPNHRSNESVCVWHPNKTVSTLSPYNGQRCQTVQHSVITPVSNDTFSDTWKYNLSWPVFGNARKVRRNCRKVAVYWRKSPT